MSISVNLELTPSTVYDSLFPGQSLFNYFYFYLWIQLALKIREGETRLQAKVAGKTETSLLRKDLVLGVL